MHLRFPGTAPSTPIRGDPTPSRLARGVAVPSAPTGGESPVCIWIASAPAAQLVSVGRLLRDILSETPRTVELLQASSNDPESASAHPLPSEQVVACLADAAAAMVRRGVAVVVACPLGTSEAVRIARERVHPLVRVFLRPAAPILGLERIPVLFRTVQNGVVVEREISLRNFEPGEHPDILVGGNLGPPQEVAREIADILYRAGWLSATGARPATPLPREPFRLPSAVHPSLEPTGRALGSPPVPGRFNSGPSR